MSEFKGTPGELTICEHSWAETSIMGGGRSIALLSIESEATEENQYELEARQLADARLMAASKDLLEALQSVVMYFWTADREPGGLSEGDVESLARAAIAKALGEDAC